MQNSDDIRRELVSILPPFDDVLRSAASVFADAVSEYTVHGLFAELSHYVSASFPSIGEAARIRLFAFVERCVYGELGADGEVSNAACTCFLENVTNEAQSLRLRTYLGPHSRAYFDQWQGTDAA